MEQHKQSISVNKTVIHFFVALAIMLCGNIVPTIEPVTRMGIQIIFVFAGMIYGWCVSSMMWPSLLGIVMLGFTEYMTNVEASFTTFITNSSVIGMITSFVFLGYLSSSGLLNSLTKKIITSRSFIGKPWKFIIVLTLAIWVISAVFHTVVTIVVFFALVESLLKDMGYEKNDLLPTFLFLDIAIIAAFGAMWLPFMPNSLFVQGLIATSLGTNITTVQYLVCISLPSFFAVLIHLIIGKFFLKIDMTKYIEASKAEASKLEAGEQITFSLNEKYAIVALIIFVLGVGLPSVLPANWLPVAILNRLGITGVSILVTIGLVILNNKNTKKPIASFKEIANEGYGDFSAIVLCGAILLVGGAVTADGTGISEALAMALLPLIDKMSITMFIVIVAVVLALISQVSMNMVLMMIFSPLLATVLVDAGYNPMMSIMISYLAPNVAFLAPSGSMPSALVFSNTAWVSKRNLYKMVVPWVVICVAVFIVCTLLFPDLVCTNLSA